MQQIQALCEDEQALLDELRANPADVAVRLIYQDWLEERGDERAEYLRASAEFAAIEHGAMKYELARRRLRKLHGRLQRRWKWWLAQVSRARIENCRQAAREDAAEEESSSRVVFDFACPRQWDGLRDTCDEKVRFCDQCDRHVFLCESVHEANRLSVWGACVAIDESFPRQKDDLAGPLRLLGRVRTPRRVTKFLKIDAERHAGQ